LFHHLNELGIEPSTHGELPEADGAAEELFRQVRKASAKPLILLSAGRSSVGVQFPAVKLWVDGGYGHVEIGDREGLGFIARALDYGGLVFEDDKPDSLAEALASLERGLAEYFEREGTEPQGVPGSIAGSCLS
jgi:hypothetical protein